MVSEAGSLTIFELKGGVYMANTRMVNITNMVNKTVGVKKMEYGVNRKWTKKRCMRM